MPDTAFSATTVATGRSSHERGAICALVSSKLKPILLELWVEQGPAVLTAPQINSVDALRPLISILQTIALLLRNEGQLQLLAEGETFRGDLRKFFAPHFPFGTQSLVADSSEVQAALLEMNIQMIEIMSLLSAAARDSQSTASEEELSTAAVAYITDILQSPDSDSAAELLPALWRFVHGLPPGDSAHLFQQLVKTCIGLPAAASAKVKFAEFIRHFQNSKLGGTVARDLPGYGPVLDDFCKDIPKVLWQLRTAPEHDTLRLLLLDTLREVLRSRAHRLANAGPDAELGDASPLQQAIQAALAPMFFTQLPARGGTPARRIFGPFLALSAGAQQRLLGCVQFLGPLGERLRPSLSVAVCSPACPAPARDYALHLLGSQQTRLFAPGAERPNAPEHYLTLLLSSLVGWTAFDLASLREQTGPAVPLLAELQVQASGEGRTVRLLSPLATMQRHLAGPGRPQSDAEAGFTAYLGARVAQILTTVQAVRALRVVTPVDFLASSMGHLRSLMPPPSTTPPTVRRSPALRAPP
ncbi:hypothetical protein H696_04102 [Fonticula alba]|uniref:Uncharacterized protein n=1 Tax=Fonticula alba TaxID=691883 RepID=A0A058Z5Z7_FONAL|nr:hypothetical protein H696_04102 [Fonticula alba]KCV69695.1 hypothetical protein H696_04102 [Fonticula alba]|eukprot:XP_009496260.1 hypothetical protein H696_04102 [Fonticula alba]